MKNSLFCHASCIAGIFLSISLQAQTTSPDISPKAVLTVMQRVADWQLANPSKHKATDWTQGAGDAGLMALAGISGDVKYRNAMLEKGATNDWKLGLRKFHADDHAVGQAYCELYFLYRDPKMLAPLRAGFDDILNHPSDAPSLDFALPKRKSQELWSWCDSLFMGPPAWVRLYTATGDERYLNFAVKEWWRTSDYLYDNAEHLYFRDSSYFKKTEANGKKVFWGRGNGWVMGGLVRTLQYLPVNHPDRSRFEKQFKEMSAKILTCQQADGLWRASLLDPDSYPLKETSGSGFYTYALAWGVNQGLLDRKIYLPAVIKAWTALVACVDADGKLTHVQPIGADPKKFDEGATEVYGVGAFLLAGSEVYRLAVFSQTKPLAVQISNPAKFWRESETVELNLSGNRLVVDGLTSRILTSQAYSPKPGADRLLFQVDLAPGETRTFYILDASALPAVPEPIVKTFARFVPERMDDYAWESDRIAHRMYGPALIKGEGTISSGVDVWVKRTRNLIIDKWYKGNDYHKDHGEGMDCYSVSHNAKPTRGCGGLGIWAGGKIWVSSNFATQRLITSGPIRSEFELTYDAWDANGRKVSEVKRMSIDANGNFTRAQSTFTTSDRQPLEIGIGIADRGGDGKVASDLKAGWLAYWEPAGGKNGANGNTACALVLPDGVQEFTKDAANLVAIAKASPGKPFVYYLGAGWSKSGDFADNVQWENYVKRFAERRGQPLQVMVGK
ncbi:MAG: glycoside hydrolase family 88 protein [Verrucomicrobiota bacterium]